MTHYELIRFDPGTRHDYRDEHSWMTVFNEDTGQPVAFSYLEDMKEYVQAMIDADKIDEWGLKSLRVVRIRAELMPKNALPKV